MPLLITGQFSKIDLISVIYVFFPSTLGQCFTSPRIIGILIFFCNGTMESFLLSIILGIIKEVGKTSEGGKWHLEFV